MRKSARVLLAAAIVVLTAAAAGAQENLEQGKSGAQLFATDCAICHKSPQALVKEGYPTEGFLRVHYTSGREMAAALFTYLRGVARADAGSGDRNRKPRAKPSSEKKSGAKPKESKTPEKKSDEKKPK